MDTIFKESLSIKMSKEFDLDLIEHSFQIDEDLEDQHQTFKLKFITHIKDMQNYIFTQSMGVLIDIIKRTIRDIQTKFIVDISSEYVEEQWAKRLFPEGIKQLIQKIHGLANNKKKNKKNKKNNKNIDIMDLLDIDNDEGWRGTFKHLGSTAPELAFCDNFIYAWDSLTNLVCTNAGEWDLTLSTAVPIIPYVMMQLIYIYFMNEYNIYTPDPSIMTPMPRQQTNNTNNNNNNNNNNDDHFEETTYVASPQNIVYNSGLSGYSWEPIRMICQNVMSSCFWSIFFPGTAYNASTLNDEIQMEPKTFHLNSTKDLLVTYSHLLLFIYIYTHI